MFDVEFAQPCGEGLGVPALAGQFGPAPQPGQEPAHDETAERPEKKRLL
jgi:hypothetical protein